MSLPPDVEGAVRTWLRAQTSIRALVGQRVFFGVPKGAKETSKESSYPMIVVARVGGALDRAVPELDTPLIQFDVWGAIDTSGNGLKADCTTVVNTLRSLLAAMDGRTTLATGTAGFGMQEVSCVWLPDPDNDRPRYVVTAEVTAIST